MFKKKIKKGTIINDEEFKKSEMTNDPTEKEDE